MRILILGAGKMGSFFTDVLSFQHETAVFDVDPKRLRFVYNTYRFTTLDEISEFKPELVINAATVKYTIDAFRQVLPVLPKDCILSDIASVKTGLKAFYEEYGRMPTEAETYNGENVGTWLMSQKKFIKSRNYPPDRFEKLQTLNLSRKEKERKEQWQQQWDNNLQMVIQFYEENGRWPKDKESYQGVNIGTWYFKQRQAAKYPSYPPERRLKLESAGVLDAKSRKKEQDWEKNFQVLQTFIQEHNRLPISGEKYMGINIGYWCIAERRNAANLPNYPEEKLQRLISLGLCSRQKRNLK
jgi:hypothetical protein